MFRINRATQITLLTIAALGGIVLGRATGYYDWQLTLGAVIIATILGLVRSRMFFPALMLLALAVGIQRGYDTQLARTPLGALIGQKVTLVGTIADDPGVTFRNRLALTVGGTYLDGHATHQSVQIKTTNKKLQRGERVSVTGKLDNNLGPVAVRMGFGQVTVLDSRVGWLERIRQRFFAALHTALPDPISGFGLGLLVGVRALIDKPLQATLSLVGLSHLIAVSGYNLTILVSAAERGLRRISLFVATAASLWLIFGFMLVAGFSASIVRAAAVSVLVIAANYYGRRIAPMTLIALPAALTALYHPDYLTRDLGWQLSFAAFFGIVVLAPLVRQRIPARNSVIVALIIESICAQIVTIPIIMHTFGTLSLISPLANALILPLVPLAMLLCFVVGLVGMAVPALAALIALPAAGLLGLMLAVIDRLAGAPAASITLRMTGPILVLTYGVVLVGIAVLQRRAHSVDRELPAPSSMAIPAQH